MLPVTWLSRIKEISTFDWKLWRCMARSTKEFDGIPGCILMTTNCFMRPRETYKIEYLH